MKQITQFFLEGESPPLNEILNKHKRLKSLNKQLTNETDALKPNVT